MSIASGTLRGEIQSGHFFIYFLFFWLMYRPNDPLWLICEELNIAACLLFTLGS